MIHIYLWLNPAGRRHGVRVGLCLQILLILEIDEIGAAGDEKRRRTQRPAGDEKRRRMQARSLGEKTPGLYWKPGKPPVITSLHGPCYSGNGSFCRPGLSAVTSTRLHKWQYAGDKTKKRKQKGEKLRSSTPTKIFCY